MADEVATRSRTANVSGRPRALVVTAADVSYFRCLEQLLLSIERLDAARTLKVIAFDLGLELRHRERLERRFSWVELRSFDLASQPAFMRMRERSINSNAWKPQLLEALLAKSDLPLLWLDSACVLLRDPERLLQQIEQQGLYAPFGGHSSIARYTHPGTAAFFGVELGALTQRMRASGVVGISPRSQRAVNVVTRWAEACRDGGCVAPATATRQNHNFDQTVLNLLLLEASRERPWALTTDELDISSTQPLPELRSRNKVKSSLPLAFDPLVRAYYATYRSLDVAVLRYRRSQHCLPFARDLGAPSAW